MQQTNADERLGIFSLFMLGSQHVLIMYAGAIATPLILGAALSLPKEQIAFLINADLFVCGVITIVQSLGIGKIGIRLPLMMGVTFTALAPMIAIGTAPDGGLVAIFGAVIIAGVLGLIIAPYVSRLLRFFPPVVTGSQLTIVGLSLMVVAATWSAGGYGNENFGGLFYLGVSGLVLLSILILARYAKGFINNIAVLIGLLIGAVIAMLAGDITIGDELANAPWFGIITPFRFGMPTFSFWPILAMSIVMLVIFIETTGMCLAMGQIVGKELTEEDLTRAFRANGIGAIIGGVFNTFAYSVYAQNIGLVSMTRVKSRKVFVAAGLILIVLALFPKAAIIVASIPSYVLGGVGIVMFGMVVASGIKILKQVELEDVSNLYIIAISIGLGMIPVVSPEFFSQMPSHLSPILNSPILLTAISAIVLNVFFMGVSNKKKAGLKSQVQLKPTLRNE